MKKALITGIFGQDGSYLCEILAGKGYELYGIAKHSLSVNSCKIKDYLSRQAINPKVFSADLNDYEKLKHVVTSICPDEIYHLAAFHVSSEDTNNAKSFKEKNLYDYNTKATSNLLYICSEYTNKTRLVAAGSCLMFDDCDSPIQNEATPYMSCSLYGLGKISENMLVKYYRQKGLHASTAILFNHESSRRPNDFVTKKIVRSMVAIKKGKIESFTLGSLEAKKDWGWARDYAYGMYLMAQAESPKDYVLASGKNHSIKDFINIVASKLEIFDWQKHVIIDNNIVTRKIKGDFLGDWTLAQNELGWKHSISLDQLVDLMVENELSGGLA